MALRILAVDDEPSSLELFKIMAEPLGCDVMAVGDSRDAARLIEHEKFDGAVVDVQMPYMDGFQLVECIRNSRLNHQVPIVMLTGHDDADTMRKGFNAGVSFFLGKPFTRERIAALFSAARGAMLKEKRKFARLPLRTTVTCKWTGQRQGQFKAGSVDICEEGMLLGPSGGLNVGQEIDLEFDLPPGTAPVRPHAKVLRREKPDHIAVQFINPSVKDRDAIKAYIFARVRN
ncbi:MAG TPA: response regulator [Terriglobia bacterium]|nr:response regulator [Terriglobia bacterium]